MLIKISYLCSSMVKSGGWDYGEEKEP